MMRSELKKRIRVCELLIIYGITLFLGIATGIVYRNAGLIEYITGVAGAIIGFIAVFLPFKTEAHVSIFFYFALSVSFSCCRPQLCTLLAVSSLIICMFPSKPEQFQVDIIVCGIISLIFTNNFTPLLLLFLLLMALDMFLDLVEYAKTSSWVVTSTMHSGRTYWAIIAIALFIICLIRFISTY